MLTPVPMLCPRTFCFLATPLTVFMITINDTINNVLAFYTATVQILCTNFNKRHVGL